VADYIALAFDDALNFAARILGTASNNDRLRLRDLLRAVSQNVRRVMRRDYDALSLP